MDAGRRLLLFLYLISVLGQRSAAPAPGSDMLILLPQPGLPSGAMQVNRLVQMPVLMHGPAGRPMKNAAGQILPHAPRMGSILILQPIGVLGQPPVPPLRQDSRALKAFPDPLASNGAKTSMQSITQAPNPNEAEPQNEKQSIDQKSSLTADPEHINSTALLVYVPIKMNGSTVLAARNVTVPISAAAREEDLTEGLMSPESGDKSAGTSLHGLTREELSEIISATVLQVMRENGRLPATPTMATTGSTSTPGRQNWDQNSADSSKEEPSEEEEGEEGNEPGLNRAAARDEPKTATSESATPDVSEAQTEPTEDLQAGGEGEESGSQGTDAATEAPETSTQQKARRQLPATIPGKKPVQKSPKSQSSRPGVFKIFQRISTTPDPEAVSPVDQPDMLDPVILTDFQEELLKNKQIVIVDRDKHKNQLFLKAIREVLQDFEKMYEIPHDEDLFLEDPGDRLRQSSPSAAPGTESTGLKLNATTSSGYSQETTTPVPLN